MTLEKKARRRFVFALAVLGCACVVAQRSALGADGVGGQDDPGLRRLEAVLEKRLHEGRNALPLPWRETILKPDAGHLVWRAHSLSAPNGSDSFRVAIDPPTRWYYIGQVGRAGAPLRLYGPLEESTKGRFIDALATAGGAASPVAQPVDEPKTGSKASRSNKPDSKSKTKVKSSTKVKD